jgi:hypothetical protein
MMKGWWLCAGWEKCVAMMEVVYCTYGMKGTNGSADVLGFICAVILTWGAAAEKLGDI